VLVSGFEYRDGSILLPMSMELIARGVTELSFFLSSTV
jgi:hypothetical protein